MKQKKIGLFFGSFNPVHIGHTAVAGYMAAFTSLDEVWMVLSPQNPFKEKESLLKDHHRLAMLRIATEPYRNLKVSDVELKLPQPSYTINTLVVLKEKYPAYSFFPIIGSDNLSNFHKWKNYEEILNQFGLYVYPRPNHPMSNVLKHPNVIYVEHSPMMEISASFIRNAVKNSNDISFLMLPKVYEYMTEMHFYE